MVDQDYQDGYEAGARGARRELDRLRAELALQNEARMQAVRDMDEAETAISRVRELCAGPLEPGCICVSCVILRALEPSDGGSA